MSAAAALLAWSIIVIVSMVITSFLARRWGRDPFGWALLSAVLGPIAIVGVVATRQADLTRPPDFSWQAPGNTAGGERILIAVDGSPVAARLARYVVDLHKPDLAPLLLFVLPHEEFDRSGATARVERDKAVEAATSEASSILREAGFSPAVVVGKGRPGEEIVRFAQEQRPAVIVVGRHGRGLSRMLLGSVSEYVVRHATQPVAVVE